jgi:Rieske Fe-S protein
MQNRRDFIRQSGAACAVMAGLGFLGTIESCKPAANATASTYDAATNKVSVPLSSFGTQNKLVIDGPHGDYKIFLMKKSDTEITALQMVCTHRGHSLNMEDADLHCPLHGSEFDFDGNVTHGPASSPLKKFPATVENGNVVVLVA